MNEKYFVARSCVTEEWKQIREGEIDGMTEIIYANNTLFYLSLSFMAISRAFFARRTE